MVIGGGSGPLNTTVPSCRSFIWPRKSTAYTPNLKDITKRTHCCPAIIYVHVLKRGRNFMTGVEQLSKLEGDIRAFVRRDTASLRRTQPNETDVSAEPSVENLDALIRRVAGTSTEEIDRVILELQGVRDMLRGEGERVS